jgi:hypothetical protein
MQEEAHKFFTMVTTHSSYLQTLKCQESTTPVPAGHPSKSAILYLLEELIKKDPVGCNNTDVLKTIIQNYHGSIQDSDIAGLQVIRSFETFCGISVVAFMKSWNEDSEQELGVDIIWMANSLHWFDPSQPIDPDSQIISDKPKLYASGLTPLYDFCFFLPYLASSIENLDAHRMLETNVIGMTVMALSSDVLETRKSANYILSKFYQILQTSNVKEKNQVLILLESFKNSLEPFQQVPTIICSFVAQGLMILLKPESHFYPLVNRFLLQRSRIDLTDVPMFYELLYSNYTTHKLERQWILRLLLNGLENEQDYSIFQRRFVIDILTTYFQSTLADNLSRKQILMVIYKTTVIKSAISSMITQSGLLVFLKTCCTRFMFDQQDEIAIALPHLLTRVYKGYMETSETWDRSVQRLVWKKQFFDMVIILLKNLNGKITDWNATFLDRVLIFAKTVVSEDDIIPIEIFENLVDYCGSLKLVGQEVLVDEFDVDELFNIRNANVALLGVQKNLYGIICKTIKPVQNQSYQKIFNWCLGTRTLIEDPEPMFNLMFKALKIELEPFQRTQMMFFCLSNLKKDSKKVFTILIESFQSKKRKMETNMFDHHCFLALEKIKNDGFGDVLERLVLSNCVNSEVSEHVVELVLRLEK